MLSEKQKVFFNNLKEKYGKEPLPSYDTIAKEFGFKHKNSVWQYFHKLKESGLIQESNKRFFISPDVFGAVLFTTSVRAGHVSQAEDYVEERVSLDDKFKINDSDTLLFKVSGDSMIDLGIFDGDTVIVQKNNNARDGEVVLAYVDGGYTLKTYRKTGSKVWLQPANENYDIIEPKEMLTIVGVAIGLTRKL